jgi:uncharacterized protein (TIGR02147 family)
MPDIFSYMNYREYLKDFYKEKKESNTGYSFRLMAMKAGFKSKSFLSHVLEGERNLTKDSLFKMNNILMLSQKEFAYFCDLVEFNQADPGEAKTFWFKKLTQYKNNHPAKIILKDQYTFYSEWYHNTIREIITMLDFNEDYHYLGTLLNPPITQKQAHDSVKLLLTLGLVEKTETGYCQKNQSITTGDEVRGIAIHQFHTQNMNIAIKSIETISSSERDISCLVAGLSKEGFNQIKKEIQEFRKRLMEIAKKDGPAEDVYHINFQFFPTTRLSKTKKGPNKKST